MERIVKMNYNETVLEKEKDKLNKLKEKEQELKGKIAAQESKIADIEKTIIAKDYKAEIYQANGLTLKEVQAAIAEGDLSVIQKKIDETKTKQETAENEVKINGNGTPEHEMEADQK